MVKKTLSNVYMALIFLFLYLPIGVLIVLSFNDSKTRVEWGGFTLKWYVECFQSETIMSAFATTLQITLISAVVLYNTDGFGPALSRSISLVEIVRYFAYLPGKAVSVNVLTLPSTMVAVYCGS